jgi:biopolymer transport protein ExbD
MKFRNTGGGSSEKVHLDMAAMIDVVFQLMIFFMLTLKITSPEGDFNINMPIGAPATAASTDINLPPLKVRLTADSEGNLTNVLLNGTSLGADPKQSFDRLNAEVLKVIGSPDNPLTEDIEVEIEADYQLHYRHVIGAVGAVTGRMQKVGDEDYRLIRYIEKIKFAPPKQAT